MRILLHPHTGLRRIRGDSNYLLFIDIARYMIEQGHYVHMIMPEFSRDSVDRIPGLMYHFVEYNYDFYTEYGIYDPRFLVDSFSRKVGKYQIDAVITAKPPLVPVYRSILSDLLRCRDIACYIVEPGVYPDEKEDVKGLVSLMETSVGYAYAKTIFLAENEKDIALRTARRWLSADLMRQFRQNAMVLPVGVPTQLIDREGQGIEKYEKFTLFYGARMNSVKQPHKIFDLYHYLYSMMGEDTQVVMTTNTQEKKFMTDHTNRTALQGKESAFDIQFECPRPEYIKKAMASHVAIAWSTDEGFPVGFWEQMYMGLPVLFWDRPWSRRQLPDWYPFIFKDKTEAYAMITYIRDNYEKVQREVMDRMRTYIKENYDANIIYHRLESEMYADLNLKLSYNMPKSLKAMALSTASLFEDEPFTMDKLLRAMEKVGTSFNRQQKVRSTNAKFPSDYDIYRCLLDNGYRDLNKTPTPIFQRIPDWDGESSSL